MRTIYHEINKDRNCLDAALAYAAKGWHVIPLHWSKKGKATCSCGNAECKSIAKHPLINRWIERATPDAKTIAAWWDRWPSANVGIVMGAKSGIIDIETDTKSNGNESLAKLEKLIGRFPKTLAFRSGSGGIHRIYANDKESLITKTIHFGKDILKQEITGIDILGTGAYAVAPPSRHANGNRYDWIL